MEVRKFDFAKYDTDKSGWLSSAEADVARSEGWCIWNGFKEEDSELAEYGFGTVGCNGNVGSLMILNSKTYSEYMDTLTEIMRDLTNLEGRYAMQEWRVGVVYSDPEMQATLETAKKMAKEKMKLPDDAFEFGDSYKQKYNAQINKIIEELKSRNKEQIRPPMGLVGTYVPDELPQEDIPADEDTWQPIDDDGWDDSWYDEPETPTKPAVPTKPTSPAPPATPNKPNSPSSTAPTGGSGTGSVKYHQSTTNRTRKKSSTNGDFCTGWVERDAYGSSTYKEWLKNNGYEYDEKNGRRLRDECAKNAKDPTLEHLCGRAYRLAAQKLGLWAGMNNQDQAYQFAGELANNPNYKELPNNIVATMDLRELPPGCIIIYDAGYKTDGKNVHGHVGVTTGNGTEYGGYCPNSKQQDGSIQISQQRKADHIRVFIPVVRK